MPGNLIPEPLASIEPGLSAVQAGVVSEAEQAIRYNPCGADFVPPPPEEMPRLLEDLYAAINDDLLPPLVQAGLVHAQLETIHPFDDGHGRTGRALVHVVLRRRGIAPRFLPPISVVFAGARERYIDGLTRFRGDQVAEWCEYFAAATARAARLARDYVDAVRRLQQSWRNQLQSSSAPPRADAALDGDTERGRQRPQQRLRRHRSASAEESAARRAAARQVQACIARDIARGGAPTRFRAWPGCARVRLACVRSAHADGQHPVPGWRLRARCHARRKATRWLDWSGRWTWGGRAYVLVS
ncbi:MAG: Fic family protein [Gemmatimonadaceae bacterium]|nr:Fic family protein [Gemmatimonadaceae bacterium]